MSSLTPRPARSHPLSWCTPAGPIVAILGAFIMAFALVAVLSLKFINFQRR